MKGKIDCLNCGAGHAEIKIDGNDPIERERGKRIISDMLRRGYALFVHGADPKDPPVRVEKFDPEKFVYIIGAEPEYAPEAPQERAASPELTAKRNPGRPRTREVPAGDSHVTAIARTAGG